MNDSNLSAEVLAAFVALSGTVGVLSRGDVSNLIGQIGCARSRGRARIEIG